MLFKVVATVEYENWYNSLSLKEQTQVDARIMRIEQFRHFGDAKNLGSGLAELRWKNGRRIYFSSMGDKVLFLLVGGIKNAQKKDIQKARILLRKHASLYSQKRG